jgi:hypothetical protein
MGRFPICAAHHRTQHALWAWCVDPIRHPELTPRPSFAGSLCHPGPTCHNLWSPKASSPCRERLLPGGPHWPALGPRAHESDAEIDVWDPPVRSSSPSQLWFAGPLSPYNVIIYFVQNSYYIVKMWHSIMCHDSSYVWDLVPAHLVNMFAPGFWIPKIWVWQKWYQRNVDCRTKPR